MTMLFTLYLMVMFYLIKRIY